jgi:Clp amino terminal domain, pathogenicity island component
MADPPLPVRLDDLLALVRSSTAGDDPLEHLAQAVLLADRLGELSDHLVGHFVDQARRSGASWTDIGRSLGVSKQAAQQRFVARALVDADTLTEGRFSRFTPRVRTALVRSAAHARDAGAPSVGPDHVLLGVLDDPGSLAVRALEAAGAPAASLRERLAVAPATRREGDEHLPFTADAKLLLDRTLREALRLGHNYVGTEHVLLALLDDDGPAGNALRDAGVQRGPTEAWIVAELMKLTRPGGAA